VTFEMQPANVADAVIKIIVSSFEPQEVGIQHVNELLTEWLVAQLRHVVDTPGGPGGAAGRAINFEARRLLRELIGSPGEGAGRDTIGEAINFLITVNSEGLAIPKPDAAKKVFDALIRDLTGVAAPVGLQIVEPMFLVDP
jgi:hypothetical protein